MSERPPATPHPSPLAWPLARLSWRLKTLAANTPCPESPGPSNRRCWACSRACPQPLLALRSGVGEPRASPVHVTAAPLLRERAKTERSYGTSSKLSAGNVRSWGSTQAGGTPPPCPLLDQSLGFPRGVPGGHGPRSREVGLCVWTPSSGPPEGWSCEGVPTSRPSCVPRGQALGGAGIPGPAEVCPGAVPSARGSVAIPCRPRGAGPGQELTSCGP